jgi:hypothetical protein
MYVFLNIDITTPQISKKQNVTDKIGICICIVTLQVNIAVNGVLKKLIIISPM